MNRTISPGAAVVMLAAGVVGAQTPVGDTPTRAQAADGQFISWREHIIDDPAVAGVPFSGSDGLVMGDVDRDAREDVVSVHESDAEYDSANYVPGFEAPLAGHVRIAFASESPARWTNITVAEGADAPAPEDAALADMNGDGYLDLLVAAELSHILYLQNPGPGGGLIWIEQPVRKGDTWNAFPIGGFAPDSVTGLETADIDGDGDIDIIAGSYSRGLRTGDGEVNLRNPLGRIGWFENPGDAKAAWRRHDISRRVRGMFDKFVARDLDGDGDIDFLGTRGNSHPYDGVFWLEQVRGEAPAAAFTKARNLDSEEVSLPR